LQRLFGAGTSRWLNCRSLAFTSVADDFIAEQDRVDISSPASQDNLMALEPWDRLSHGMMVDI
jgi:hypothetical protein